MNLTNILIIIVANALPSLIILKYKASYINIDYIIYILKSGQSLYIQSIGSSLSKYNRLLKETFFNLKQLTKEKYHNEKQ